MTQRNHLYKGLDCLDILKNLIDNEYDNKLYLNRSLFEIKYELERQINCLPHVPCDI